MCVCVRIYYVCAYVEKYVKTFIFRVLNVCVCVCIGVCLGVCVFKYRILYYNYVHIQPHNMTSL